MNTTRLGITLPLAVIVAGVAVAASSAAESQLKWTPHRDAAST